MTAADFPRLTDEQIRRRREQVRSALAAGRGGSFATLIQCPGCAEAGGSCLKCSGEAAINASRLQRAAWEAETAARLSAQVGHDQLYPLLTLCKVGYSTSQLAKAVGKLLVEQVRTRALVRSSEHGVGVVGVPDGVTHHSLLTLHGLPTRYVASALLLACWWLQRKGWARRAAMPWSRPSGTAGGAR